MKRTRLKPRSAKRVEQDERRRDVLMIVHVRDGFRCQAEKVWPEVTCGGRLDGHEPLPRSRGGDPLDPDQVISICRQHHDCIHSHPTLARERGLTL